MQLFGPLWPIDPDIHHHETKDAFYPPVCLEEQKRVFDMKDVEFIRGVDLVWFEDANGYKCVFRDGAFASGKLSIPANTPGNVPCDTSQLI